ncbi:hypothetical protein ACFQV2_31630 [Actinokineospora soli]|uniref:Uncharacterized protein n=1 Tax=Actinokineospora soli TaxID=1048753 RepID=A0ABW2TTV7_9PSEU
MTHDRHIKATTRNRAECLGQTYTQARRDILGEVERLHQFPHLPITWEVGRPSRRCAPEVAAYRGALGAVELALRDCDILSGAANRDRWRTLDGHIDLDWEGGPFAHDVVCELIALAEDELNRVLVPGEVAPGMDRIGNLNAVWINGVRVRFRPFRPIGAEASHQLAWEALRERMEATHRT